MPYQYPIVGENLIASFGEVLGNSIDQATVDAWKVAYQQLANIFISAEEKLYNEASIDGWNGILISTIKPCFLIDLMSIRMAPFHCGKENCGKR